MPNSSNLPPDFDSLAELLAFDFSNLRKGNSGPLIERGSFSTIDGSGNRAVYAYVRSATAGGEVATGGGRLFLVDSAAAALEARQQTLYVGANYSIGSSDRDLTFDGSFGDAECGGDLANGRFTPTEKGWYQLSAARSFTSGATDSMLYAIVSQSGVITTYRNGRGALSSNGITMPSLELDPTQNDYIQLKSLQGSTETVRGGGPSDMWTWATLTKTDMQSGGSAGLGGATIYGAEKLGGETLTASQASISIPVSKTYDLIEGDLSLRTNKVSVEFPSIVINGDTNNANYDRHSLNGNESNASVIGVAGSQVLFPVGYAGTQVGQFAAT
ncbi:MAG: hypothetical protein AAFY15_11040, partial [Cyanobacteria bacterium J06648_11]